jgi:hypothetical protein
VVRIARIGPWQLALIAGLGLVALVVLTVVLFWVGLLLALAVGLVLLNVLYLPRVAVRLGLPTAQLALWLLPVAAVVGFLIGGSTGAAWGAAGWLAVIAAPRLAIAYFGRRLRVSATRWVELRGLPPQGQGERTLLP